MKKLIKAMISAVLIATIVGAFALTASASDFSHEDYLQVYEMQKSYYLETYVPTYNNYNQMLRDLRTRIHNTDFETREQAERVLAFLNDLAARRFEFYGNRETVGKSRYEVPRMREAMYANEEAGKYFEAIDCCGKLNKLNYDRVAFIKNIEKMISSFEILSSK